MKDNFEYFLYKRTVDMFCNSSVTEDVLCHYSKKLVKLELSCLDCFCTFKTQSCLNQHKRNWKCKLQERCLKCNKKITFGSKREKIEVLSSHDCNKKIKFCKVCWQYHNENQEHCKLNIWENHLWKINPKICVLSAAISDKNNYVDCLLCSDKKDFCHFHSNLPNQSRVNFVSTIREIDLHSIFCDNFFSDYGVESDEK